MITVGIVDDEPQVCLYLHRILEAPGSDVRVVGQAHDGPGALDLVRTRAPHVLLLDLRIPSSDGLSVLEQTRALEAPPAVVILTGFPDDRLALRAWQSGAAGFLTKSTPPAQITSVVQLAAAGHRVVGPGVRPDSAPPPGGSEATRQRLREMLTPRESQVLRLLATGASNAQIARELGVSEATVKGHVSNVMIKLGCDSRLQAGLLAQRAWSR